jgi:glutathione S-transferase
MKLYCDPISTTSRPVMLFIAEHGLDVELVHVGLMAGAHQEPDYLAINPNGLVPFLTDGDLALGETTAILRYLADKVGSATYPRDLLARAKVDEALGWFSTNLHEFFCLMAVYPQMGIPYGLGEVLTRELTAFGAQRAPRWLQVLDRHMLAGRPFVCGDSLSIADYLGVAFVTLGEAVSYDLSPYPNIRAWVARMKSMRHWPTVWAAFDGMVAARQVQAAA